ncbi:MAG: hypothetical protein KAI74_02795, partial [Kiritimatiellae bacterium]|nr:hypothetical protein [Kiritimatiellia bacterium]
MKNDRLISRILISITVVLTATLQLGAATTYTVGASGASNTTIAAAMAVCVDGDTIEIIDAVHTESNITINVDVTIKGQGADQTTVQAAATRGTAGESIFSISGDRTVSFQDLTLKHGDGGTYGGAIHLAIWADITLTVERCSFEDNNAQRGAGILYLDADLGEGAVTILDSTFSGNIATNASLASGGAIFVGSIDNVFIRNSTFSGNEIYHSGYWVYGGAVSVTPVVSGQVQNCSFVGNIFAGVGGPTTQQGGSAIGASSLTVIESC